MKVFISSTVHDLLDVRAEVEKLLETAGLMPVMSERDTSNFAQIPNMNSIDVCLSNLSFCKYCIVILSQRYGPMLKNALPAYGEVSATHLEYRTAMESGIEVFFYVREDLFREFELWRRNGRPTDLSKFLLNWTPIVTSLPDNPFPSGPDNPINPTPIEPPDAPIRPRHRMRLLPNSPVPSPIKIQLIPTSDFPTPDRHKIPPPPPRPKY